MFPISAFPAVSNCRRARHSAHLTPRAASKITQQHPLHDVPLRRWLRIVNAKPTNTKRGETNHERALEDSSISFLLAVLKATRTYFVFGEREAYTVANILCSPWLSTTGSSMRAKKEERILQDSRLSLVPKVAQSWNMETERR